MIIWPVYIVAPSAKKHQENPDIIRKIFVDILHCRIASYVAAQKFVFCFLIKDVFYRLYGIKIISQV